MYPGIAFAIRIGFALHPILVDDPFDRRPRTETVLKHLRRDPGEGQRLVHLYASARVRGKLRNQRPSAPPRGLVEKGLERTSHPQFVRDPWVFEALNVAEICLDDGIARRQVKHRFYIVTGGAGSGLQRTPGVIGFSGRVRAQAIWAVVRLNRTA